ncbi:hypothetical protein BgiMline_005103 [Biomphalaria glabrata]|nr:cadherin-99C-like [Biomphalaria glabrata]
MLLMSLQMTSLGAVKCYGKTNDTLTRKCALFCTENDCPSYCICVHDKSENNACSYLPVIPNNTLQVKETITAGTPILSINSTGSDKWTLALQRSGVVDGSIWNELSSYFKLYKFGNIYEIILDQTPDLEGIFERFAIKLKQLTVILTCKIASTPYQSHSVHLEILPVNEFAPEYKEAILKQNVSENTKLGSVILMLINLTMDRDVNPDGRELGDFGMTDYLFDAMRDGKEYFEMKDFSQGSIVVKKLLDFEALVPMNATRFYLNVSASDIHGVTTYTTLTINIVDVDDLPPEFYYSGCPVVLDKTAPCHVAYEALLSLNYIGPMTDIVPSLIHARDMDTLNTELEFSLELSAGEKLANLLHFTIDQSLGDIKVTAPFIQTTEVNLVVVAREKSFLSKSSRASLHVLVEDAMLEVLPLKNAETTTASLAYLFKGGQFYALIIHLVGGVIIVLLILLVIYLCVRLKKLSSSTIYPGDSPESAIKLRQEPNQSVNNDSLVSPTNTFKTDDHISNSKKDQLELETSGQDKTQSSSQGTIDLVDNKARRQSKTLKKHSLDLTLEANNPFSHREDTSLGNVNKSCFNGNESSTAIITYYFNGRQSAEFQSSQSLMGAQCIVPMEDKELWGRHIVSRQFNDTLLDKFRVNSANILVDQDVRSVGSLRSFSQHIKQEHDSGREGDSSSSESSTCLYSSSSTTSPEPVKFTTKEPCSKPRHSGKRVNIWRNNSKTCKAKTDSDSESLASDKCSPSETKSETSCSGKGQPTNNQSRVNTEIDQPTFSQSQYQPEALTASQKMTESKILSIMPLNQHSFIFMSDDSCSQKRDSNLATVHQKLLSSHQNADSSNQRKNSTPHRRNSLHHDLSLSHRNHDSRIKRPFSSFQRPIFNRKRRNSFHVKSNSPGLLSGSKEQSSILSTNFKHGASTISDQFRNYQKELNTSVERIPTLLNADLQSQQEDGHQKHTTLNAQFLKSALRTNSRPHTCPSETHAAENFLITLPNRPWTSEVSAARPMTSHKKSFVDVSVTRCQQTSQNATVTQKVQAPEHSPAPKEVNKDPPNKRTSSGVSFHNVTRRDISNARLPRRLNRVKKKRQDKQQTSERRISQFPVNRNEIGDSASRHRSGKGIRYSHMSPQQRPFPADLNQQEGCWPPDLSVKPRVRRLPSLEKRPIPEFPWPNPLIIQPPNEQRMPTCSSLYADTNEHLLPSEQVGRHESKTSPNARISVTEGDNTQ